MFIEPVCADNDTANRWRRKDNHIECTGPRVSRFARCRTRAHASKMRACFTTPTRCCSPASSSDSRSVSISSFPSFSIGLASYLAVLEALWLKTGKALYLDLFKYWLKIFAVVFAMGVVSGIVMSYQFGTNWAVFSDKAGPVIGPLMAYEVLTAFFLEAGFLGVMLFGMQKVGRRLHFFATLMVAIGTFISAFWILSVNSWMQTPTGLRDQRRRAVRAGRGLGRHHLQSELSVSARAHRHRGLSDYRARGRRGGRLAPAEGFAAGARAQDVLHGDVDGRAGGAGADLRRRPARPQHARAPAREGDGDGRALPESSGRRAAHPVRNPERRRAAHGTRRRDSAAVFADPQARSRCAAGRPRHRWRRRIGRP